MFNIISPTSEVYAFHIDSTDTDPDDCVTYLGKAVGMTPAGMNFDEGTFSYGSWENAFFMPRPCFLNRNGTVDFYLYPNDYTKKSDGVTPSHVDHLSNIELGSTSSRDYSVGDYLVRNDNLYIVIDAIAVGDTFTVDTNIELADDAPTDVYGNAMMEWGKDGKKIWYKVVPDVEGTSVTVYIADAQVDSGYHCWSFYDKTNTVKDHFYTGIYNSTYDVRGVLRSLSGEKPYRSLSFAGVVTAAELNNVGTDKGWYMECYSDWFLIAMLTVLIGKSIDTQSKFGNGYADTILRLSSGTMDTRGMFWGEVGFGVNEGVKVFGMENWWGNMYRMVAGYLMNTNTGIIKYKLTRGNADGSLATDYNATAVDYLTGGEVIQQAAGYITKIKYYSSSFCQVNTLSGASAVSYGDWYKAERDPANKQYILAYGGGDNANAFSGAFGQNIKMDAADSSSSEKINAVLTYR